MEKIDKAFLVVLFISILAVLILISPTIKSASYQEKTTPSNTTVSVFVEITLSDNLTAGILFGSVEQNSNDNNASGNYGEDNTTQFTVTAGAANSVNIDLCIKDNMALDKSPGVNIPNTGYTYNFTSTTDVDNPTLPGKAITTSYVTTQHANIAAGVRSYSRFWLDVPAAQVAGTYSNTVYIKGIETGQSC